MVRIRVRERRGRDGVDLGDSDGDVGGNRSHGRVEPHDEASEHQTRREGSLFESVDAARPGLHIKLMQEGRMRGQAFVTFPSVDLAQHALNLVNGYVFKGKPMIIQFGRNLVAGKAT